MKVFGNDGIPAIGADVSSAPKLSARIIDKPVDPTAPVQDITDLFDRRLVADIKDGMTGARRLLRFPPRQSSASPVRPVNTTNAPRAANSCAMHRPIPPPVTTMT